MSSKKKVDENAVFTELSESRFFHPRESEDTENTAQQSRKNEDADSTVDNEVDQQTDHTVDTPVDRPASRPVNQSTSRQDRRHPSEAFDKSGILGRPKSFYITKKQDKDLDILVQKLAHKLEGKINQKIDRSLVVRLILESTNITDDQTVGVLASRLVDKLVNQLVD